MFCSIKMFVMSVSFLTANQPHPKPWITGQALAKHEATKGTSKNGGAISDDVSKVGGRGFPPFPPVSPVFPPIWQVRFSGHGTYRPLRLVDYLCRGFAALRLEVLLHVPE